ncbi:transcription elongation factor GreA [Candidatus Uhrbacteria bacterium]|nr:transcription elongation factor GreA [Candidatus Uhrbacteria bacterium]MBD3283842.1 transcription elongation factor GreA [Candidatus Uhrbacteria bacterium]
MQIPQRRSQKDRKPIEGPVYLTKEGIRKLEEKLRRLKHQRPALTEDLSVALQKGDLSENAEYQDARAKLSRTDTQILITEDKLRRVVEIPPPDPSRGVTIGSTVVVLVDGVQRSYQILGSDESDPALGKISHQSPLGSALMGKKLDEEVTMTSASGKEKTYRIIALS